MTQELLELAERCERATEASHELDREIGFRMATASWGGDPYDKRVVLRCPYYTASLDAAMMLVPESPYGADINYYGAGKEARASCFGPTGERISSHSATPALALCAAALRARAQQEKTK